MFIQLDLVRLQSAIQDSGVTRPPTEYERFQIDRIVKALERGYQDPNVQDVFIRPELSPRDVLLLCSSGCPEVIELALQLLCYQEGWKINPEHETSLLIGVLALEPRLFIPLLQSKGWRYRDETSDTLKTIEVRYQWKRRPRRKQRRRGYSDHGTLPDDQKRLRSLCLSKYYIEQFEQLQRTDRETRQTLEFLAGMLM